MKTGTIWFLAGGLLVLAALVAALLLMHANRSAGNTAVEQSADVPSTAQPAAVPEPTAQQSAPAENASLPMETVTFQSSDDLTITADLYLTANSAAPFILLFHQAGYSRGEYLEIAPKLNAMGYNCLAVDQRSGKTFNGVANETYTAAKAKGLPTLYADAYPDLEAALGYVVKQYAPQKLIVWGSSYSASLVLILAAEHPEEIQAALSFSPGEYFRFEGRTIAEFAATIKQPVFITSALSEEASWRKIADQIHSEGSVFFVPEGRGTHGSSALFEATLNHAEYWTAVEGFLDSLNEA